MRHSSPCSRSVITGIEILESRIAPAILHVGVIPTSEDTEYSDTPFVKMQTGTDAISNAVGHAADTYYVEIGAGKAFDRIDIAGPRGTFEEFITVKSGTIVAFFKDLDHDNEIQRGELMGLALGPKVSVSVKGEVGGGDIGGSVVSNFDVANDTLTLNQLSADHGIVELSAGFIAGKILSGGSISKATFGDAIGVYAGGGANFGAGAVGQSYSFFAGVPAVATLDATTPVGPGASISNLTATSLVEMRAGDGGAGAAGGSITNIQILGDADGMTLAAGNGGNADPAAGKLRGGPGGKLQNIIIGGVANDNVPQSLITLTGGKGGNALAGIAGAGGAVSSIHIGFAKSGARAVLPSLAMPNDDVLLVSGQGGDGKVAGPGGVVSMIRINVATDNGAGNDLVVGGGAGGSSSGVSAGRGGSVSQVEVLNYAAQVNTLNAVNAQIVVYGGTGGSASSAALGAAGGSITDLKLLGSGLSVLGGAGSSGKTGGDGGSLLDIEILQTSDIFARDGVFNAGAGGNGTTGKGGRGGNITDLKTVGSSDFASLFINSGTAASGGDSVSGAGGLGGSVSGLTIRDSDSRDNPAGFPILTGSVTVRTGPGGDGAIAQAGGSLRNATLFTENLNQTIVAGPGGNGLGSGNGGAGGQITGLNILATGESAAALPVFVQVVSGNGGNGGTASGNHSSGGAAGSIAEASVLADGSVGFVGGNGGNGDGGAAGSGGSVLRANGSAGNGDVLAPSTILVRAGDAGAAGARPGAGGNISGAKSGSEIFSTVNVTLLGGSGSGGGRGGSVTKIAYGAPDSGLLPRGSILVQAGNGSLDGANHFAGPGGSISFVTGPVTSGEGFNTIFRAGNGAGSPSHSSAGGSISHVTITGGPDDLAFLARKLIVEAGAAGNAGSPASSVTVARGANGGSVSNFTMSGVDANTIFQSIAGGDGGPGKVQGGRGGSVTHVQVDGHDIGVKTGQNYGYATMGGIFAGLGGDGGATDGLAGNVQFIRADSISAIVAGKGNAPGLVQQVDHIMLNPGPGLAVEVPGGTESLFALTFHPIVEVVTVVDGNGSTQESQTITRLLGGSNSAYQPRGGSTTFQLTYGFSTTGPIDANADASTINDALNNLLSVLFAGGVSVTDNAADPNALDKGGQTFTVTFNSAGNRSAITGAGSETTAILSSKAPAIAALALNQIPNIDDHISNNGKFDGVDVSSTGDTSFAVIFHGVGNQGDITGERIFNVAATGIPPVRPGFFSQDQNFDVLGVGTFSLNVDVGYGAETTERLAANATADEVAKAINDLNGVQAVGEHVTVSPGANSSYNIHFLFSEDIITGREFQSLTNTTTVQGTGSVAERTTLSFEPLTIFDRAEFASAHFVGAIADYFELNAGRFRFNDANGNGVYDFAAGEVPIDGLIAAKKLSLKAPTNFFPEARYALQLQTKGPFVAVPAGMEFVDNVPI